MDKGFFVFIELLPEILKNLFILFAT